MLLIKLTTLLLSYTSLCLIYQYISKLIDKYIIIPRLSTIEDYQLYNISIIYNISIYTNNTSTYIKFNNLLSNNNNTNKYNIKDIHIISYHRIYNKYITVHTNVILDPYIPKDKILYSKEYIREGIIIHSVNHVK